MQWTVGQKVQYLNLIWHLSASTSSAALRPTTVAQRPNRVQVARRATQPISNLVWCHKQPICLVLRAALFRFSNQFDYLVKQMPVRLSRIQFHVAESLSHRIRYFYSDLISFLLLSPFCIYLLDLLCHFPTLFFSHFYFLNPFNSRSSPRRNTSSSELANKQRGVSPQRVNKWRLPRTPPHPRSAHHFSISKQNPPKAPEAHPAYGMAGCRAPATQEPRPTVGETARGLPELQMPNHTAGLPSASWDQELHPTSVI